MACSLARKDSLLGFAPACVGPILLVQSVAPDILIARDGRDVGLVDTAGRLFLLKDSPGSYAPENLIELAGTEAKPRSMTDGPRARCSADFCSIPIERSDRTWHLMVAQSDEHIDQRALAAACERSDIVIAERWLPFSCRPRWLKADRRFLEDNGGTAIYLGDERIKTVGAHQGKHGWRKAAQP